jgi:hypothetical protein
MEWRIEDRRRMHDREKEESEGVCTAERKRREE